MIHNRRRGDHWSSHSDTTQKRDDRWSPLLLCHNEKIKCYRARKILRGAALPVILERSEESWQGCLLEDDSGRDIALVVTRYYVCLALFVLKAALSRKRVCRHGLFHIFICHVGIDLRGIELLMTEDLF